MSVRAILFSGGLDSGVLLGEQLRRGHVVQPIRIRSDVGWETVEARAAGQFLQALAQPQLRPLIALEMRFADLYGAHWSLTGRGVPAAADDDQAVFLPGRNLLLASKAIVWCQLNGIGELHLAALGSSPFPDASTAFADSLQTIASMGHPRSVHIRLPFADLTKRHVMQLGRGLPLEATFSCLAPDNGRHCGRCNKCHERRAAFAGSELPDPTLYAAEGTPLHVSRIA